MNIRRTAFIATLVLVVQLVLPLTAQAATISFTPNPQTIYARSFITKCNGQQWFINEIERLLNQEQKTIDTVTSSSDFANIRSLGLKDRKIAGNIPSAIGELTNLEYLFLPGNSLSGTIPSELYALSNLKYIDLSGNHYSGYIPSEFGDMPALTALQLKNNQYTGNIPTTILANTNISVLNLTGNKLTGGIPSDINKMVGLQYLNLSNNALGGPIPDVSTLTSLKALSLWSCGLTGSIPSSIYSLTKLQILDLADNSLSGTISSDISKLTALQDLSLASNSLRGTIPDAFDSIVDTIHLEDNYLRGTVPATLKARYDDGATVYLSNNYLTGINLKSITNNDKNLGDGASTEQFKMTAAISTMQIYKTSSVNIYSLLSNNSVTSSDTSKVLLYPSEYTLTYDNTKLNVTVSAAGIYVTARTDIPKTDNVTITVAVTDNTGSAYSQTAITLTTDTVAPVTGGGAGGGGGGTTQPPVTRKAYVNGYTDGIFKPNDPVTREQVAKMVITALGSDGKHHKTETYSDVPSDRWSFSYIEEATDLGYLKGYDGKFMPATSMTRSELATCLVRIVTLRGTSAGSKSVSFSDVKPNAWYYEYVKQASALGLVEGYMDGTFGPEKTVTRAEAVTMINRMLKRDPTSDPAIKTLKNPFTDVSPNYWAYEQIIEAAVTH